MNGAASASFEPKRGGGLPAKGHSTFYQTQTSSGKLAANPLIPPFVQNIPNFNEGMMN